MIRERYPAAPFPMSNNDLLRWFLAKEDGHPLPPRKIKHPSPLSWRATDAFLASYAWRVLRMEVLIERGARCECCGANPRDGVTVLNVDHIKPRRFFPALALDKTNLQVLCHACNHGKGNWDATDWRESAS